MVIVVGLALAPFATMAQRVDADVTLARIRAEGLERFTALSLFLTLTDEIGARLTGSPAHLRSANWARDRFAQWGLTNARLEPFEFGAGWELLHVSAAMTQPRYFPLIAYPEAWSSSTAGMLSGRVVYIGDKTLEQVTAMAPTTLLQMNCVKDIGAYGALAFVEAEKLNGREIDIAGDAVTMPQAAVALTQALGRPIDFVQIPISEVRKNSEDFALMLEWFERVGYNADIESNQREFGITPTSLAQWAGGLSRE